MKCKKCSSSIIHLMESDREGNEYIAGSFKPYKRYFLKCGDCGSCGNYIKGERGAFALETNDVRVPTLADAYAINEHLREDAEPNKIYSFEQMVSSLALRDSPCLLLIINDNEAVVQHSHCTNEEMLKDENWTNSKWRYIRETYEWIPIFKFAGTQTELHELINYELDINCHAEENEYWVTPKHLPREQYKY